LAMATLVAGQAVGHPPPPSPRSGGSSAFSYPTSRERCTKQGFRR
jgi:hypothetical protein